jgi:predicted Rossmann-fold nucleotide-binding protein
VAASDLFVRLRRLIKSDAYVALPGGAGTLGEVALAWNLIQTESISPRPLILVGPRWRALVDCFQRTLSIEARDFALLTIADSVDDVVPQLTGIRGTGVSSAI